jgi:hypothetical protein
MQVVMGTLAGALLALPESVGNMPPCTQWHGSANGSGVPGQAFMRASREVGRVQLVWISRGLLQANGWIACSRLE